MKKEFQQISSDLNIDMKNTFILSFLYLRLGLAAPFATSEERAATFQKMDDNGDGSISFDEWLAFSNKEIISQVAL